MNPDEDIDTNRPSFMFSPIVVPRGSIQLENGTLYQHFQHGVNYFDISETQVRLGILKRTEFQIYVPDFVLTHQEHTNTTPAGVSDLGEVGIKQQLGPFKEKLQLTVIGSLDIPSGSRTISGTGVQPVFRAPWSYQLTKNWAVMGMQSVLVLNSGRDVQYQPDFMVSRSVGPKAAVFAEWIAFFTHHAQSVEIAHFGGVYKLNRHNQLDAHFGFGMNKAAPAAFLGGGYSYRFDGLAW